jgi:alkanesulfonate monooxygenase SsuD/methylene tetrahydromethanopterin reductase-like flavin-dependent oxidoreductase (luciferase family)
MLKLHAQGVVDAGDLREQIRSIEKAGLDGFFMSDHLFVSAGQARRESFRGGDPFIRLAVAGSLSERLALGTCVVNIGFSHPALAVRSFLELAALVGGERVLAGIGGGWNPEEFDSLGIEFASFNRRMDRLEEAAQLARALFDDGFATLAGEYVTARELPLGPTSETPPRLLLGGGSDRLLEIAGRYADVVDLNGSSRRLPLGGSQPLGKDAVRRLTTTVPDLEGSVERVFASAAAAGRNTDALQFSIVVSTVRFCSSSEVTSIEEEICVETGIEPQSLADCPYVFIGPAERMQEQLEDRVRRIGLSHLIAVPLEYDTLARFRQDVVSPVA